MRAALIITVLLAVSVIERAWLAGVLGGSAVTNAAVVLVIVRMTALSRRGLALWIIAAAAIAELFSQSPFGAVAVGICIGCIATRSALLSLFSHRAFLPRVVCAAIGLLIASFVESGIRLASGAVAGPLGAALGSATATALEIAGWNMLLAVLLFACGALLRRLLGSVFKPLAFESRG